MKQTSKNHSNSSSHSITMGKANKLGYKTCVNRAIIITVARNVSFSERDTPLSQKYSATAALDLLGTTNANISNVIT